MKQEELKFDGSSKSPKSNEIEEKSETAWQKRIRIANEEVEKQERLRRIEEESEDSKVGSRYYQ